MAYYVREPLKGIPALSVRRPTINEFFLSSYTLSMYNGCEFGCPYCDSWVYSERPLNETIRVPVDLAEHLTAELAGVDQGDLIAITALSDPYQPAEQTYRLTRQTLQILADQQRPTLVMTKSPLILEDLALLQRINEQSLALVVTTLLTADPHMASRLEGKAPAPAMRLDMLAELKRAGIPVGVAFVPIMPYVNDTNSNIRSVLRAAADAGVDFVIWDYLHLANERHRVRINEILARLGSYPVSYYRDIYGDQAIVSSRYRHDRDTVVMDRCNGLGLETRVPQHIFAGKLAPHNEAALLLKHAAFRDRVAGRDQMAELHRQLADQVYTKQVVADDLRRSPLANEVRKLIASR
ncbi:MAG: radical SAM protein [Chloroflexia bacterium]|nr:radical SAM protein [Chloroflexia bacterium]